jgi:hypothetical protein
MLEKMQKKDISEKQEKILGNISGGIKERIDKKHRPSIYYKPLNGKDLRVFMVVEEYDSRIEDKIYDMEKKVITQFLDSDINFRLTSINNKSEKKFIPQGFTKWAIA